ncbi:MAG TPA: hypothetical protein VD867_03420 [Burkholderiales bacterium]|nr:hypothetical protein [Burkholderiales bacterium]
MTSTHTLVLLCACFAPGASLAAVSPAPPAAPVAEYRSAFESYRAYREEPIADWRAVNEDVARAGGHIGIMRSAPAAGTAHPPARDSVPAPGAHRH